MPQLLVVSSGLWGFTEFNLINSEKDVLDFSNHITMLKLMFLHS